MQFDFEDLKRVPEFLALLATVEQQGQEIKDLRAQLPEWVDQIEAKRLTGLSRKTLYRLREQKALEWKQDHGVRYLRASLLAHNRSRAVGRGYASPLRSV